MAAESNDPERDLIDEALASWSRERPDLKTAPVAVVMRINRLATHFHAEMDTVFAEFGLSNPSFELLATLRRSGHPYRLSQRQLAEILGLTAGTVSLRVKRMVQDGLVTVEPDPTDMRVSFVRLTEEGQRRFDEAAPAHLAGEEDMIRVLPDEEQAILATLLRKMLLSFEGSPASLTPSRAAGLRVTLRSPRGSAERRAPGGGARVTAVAAGSPAADAGLRRGDVILAVADHPVRSPGSLDRAISVARRAGDATVDVLRDGRRHRLTLAPREDRHAGRAD
jgi:DNA-binding MarR family transcriptional regulator